MKAFRLDELEAERAANVEKAIDRWRRATSIQGGQPQEPAPHHHQPAASAPYNQPAAQAAQPQAQIYQQAGDQHPRQPSQAEPSGQNALTRGLQAALANEGLFSRNRS